MYVSRGTSTIVSTSHECGESNGPRGISGLEITGLPLLADATADTPAANFAVQSDDIPTIKRGRNTANYRFQSGGS